MHRLTRRGLLRGATGLAAGYWAGRLLAGDGYPAYATGLPTPAVVVAEGTNDDSAEVLLRTALAPLGGIERFVKPGQTVAIKPNATWDKPPHTASSTDPDLLRALINMVKAAGASRVIVIDRSVFDPVPYVLDVSGLGAVLEETGAENHIMDRYQEPKSKYTEIEIPEGRYFETMNVIKVAVEADVRINMAVAKSHIVTPVTLCCKHMMGFLEIPGNLHVSLDQGIADIGTAPAIKPVLHILEAIRVRVQGAAYGSGTDITDPQRVKRMNQIVAGTDPVLIDSYATTAFFQRSGSEITHIKRCFEIGLGEIDLDAATEAGLIQKYRPEDIKPTPTPTATATATPRPTTAAEPDRPTDTAEAPTAAPAPSPTAPPRVARVWTGNEVMDPGTLLNAPLVPAAAIVGGLGLVVGRRLAGSLRAEEGDRPSEGDDPGRTEGAEATDGR